MLENLSLEPDLQRELSKMCMRSLNSVDLTLPDPPPIVKSENTKIIQEFFLLMAICNTVVVSTHAHEDLVSVCCIIGCKPFPWLLYSVFLGLKRFYRHLFSRFICVSS